MRSILHVLIIAINVMLGLGIGLNIKTPNFLKISAMDCPFTLNMEKIPVMVVRVIENSSLPKEFSRRCFLNQMNEKEGIIFVNRENEPQILNELAHQSEIPSKDETVQPIGEILVPSHLYVINERNNHVEVSLSEIKSGIYIFREEFAFNPMIEVLKEHSETLFKLFVGLFCFSVSMIISYMCTSPIFTWLKRREEISLVNHKYTLAQKLIAQNNIYQAGNLLVECAQSPYDSQGKRESLNILKGLSNVMKG